MRERETKENGAAGWQTTTSKCPGVETKLANASDKVTGDAGRRVATLFCHMYDMSFFANEAGCGL